ncbi:MAG: WYL domain-containing protein [Clostridia bacterium]|nr:WYL domain-containing protein [Clostridia bacterium]
MAAKTEFKLKILYILKYLSELSDEEHPLSTIAITEKLKEVGITVERKTVYDDIASLQSFGYSINRTRKNGGGYYLAQRDFELPELKLLVDAVQASKFITKQKSAVLIKKLSSLVNCHDADALNRQVYVSSRIKTMNESIYSNIDIIHTAINSNVQICFKYFDWTPQKKKVYRHKGRLYQVSPWSLCWEDENYYMMAYDGEAGIVKHFRVDKMKTIGLTDLPRRGEEFFKNFDPALYSRQTFGMFGGALESVTLRCDNSLAGVMIDRFGEDISFFPEDEGTFLVSISVRISNTFLSWILQFGDKVQIVSPGHVKEKMRELLSSVEEYYK